jgi:hypothetical protein
MRIETKLFCCENNKASFYKSYVCFKACKLLEEQDIILIIKYFITLQEEAEKLGLIVHTIKLNICN